MSASKAPKRAPTSDYGVGYARPPKATQFQPGCSGNREGRPKGRPSLNEIILEEAARIAKVKVGEKVLHIDKDRALMRRLFDLGLHGNVPALRFAMSLLAQPRRARAAFLGPRRRPIQCANPAAAFAAGRRALQAQAFPAVRDGSSEIRSDPSKLGPGDRRWLRRCGRSA